jgi:hypothetical protein
LGKWQSYYSNLANFIEKTNKKIDSLRHEFIDKQDKLAMLQPKKKLITCIKYRSSCNFLFGANVVFISIDHIISC